MHLSEANTQKIQQAAQLCFGAGAEVWVCGCAARDGKLNLLMAPLMAPALSPKSRARGAMPND